MNLEYYRIFYEVGKYENITKAATCLNVSQPAVSKTVKLLEESLKCQLFIRTKKGMLLTEEGRVMFKYIEKSLELISVAEKRLAEMKNLELGSLIIGTNTTIVKEYLMKYIKIYHEKYPKIKIEIKTLSSRQLLKDLKDGLINVVFINSGSNITDEYEIYSCKKLDNVFVANNNYQELKTKLYSIKELENYNFVFQGENSSTNKALNTYFEKNNVEIKNYIRFAGYSLGVESIKAGLGIGLAVKQYIKKELDNGQLFCINVKEQLPKKEILLVTHKKNKLTLSSLKFIEIIKTDI